MNRYGSSYRLGAAASRRQRQRSRGNKDAARAVGVFHLRHLLSLSALAHKHFTSLEPFFTYTDSETRPAALAAFWRIQWDGQDLALVTGGNGVKPVLYRFTVSGGKGVVVQSVHLNGLSYDAWFAIGDGRIVGTSRVYGTKIRYWPYPGGGGWTTELTSSNVEGMAIAPL